MRSLLVGIIVFLLCALWVMSYAYFFGSRAAPVATPLLAKVQLEPLSQLATLRVRTVEIYSDQELRRWESTWVGSVKASFFAVGDADIVVDLSQAKLEVISEQGRSARVKLPQPRVERPRLDLTKSRFFNERGAWMLPDDDLTARLRQTVQEKAQKLVLELAHTNENLTAARDRAADLIKKFYQQAGWEVEVVWEANRE